MKAVILLLASLVALIALFAGPTLLKVVRGVESGRSFEIEDRFVVITAGVRMGRIQFVIVRDWPIDSDPDSRHPDPRISTNAGGQRMVRGPTGSINVLERQPSLYFFEGRELSITPLEASESDRYEAPVRDLEKYAEIREHFKSLSKSDSK